MNDNPLRDWTLGHPGIVGYRCDACSHSFYFAREFCPACGSTAVTAAQSEGIGTIEARTLVHRPPTEELRAEAPYRIVLVRLNDGFRVMGHGAHDLSIGDRVRAEFVAFGDQPAIPRFLLLEDPR